MTPVAETISPPLAGLVGTRPRGAFAPAIILRRRTNRGLVEIYQQIVSQIQQMYAPMEELGKKQEELSRQQELLGNKQEALVFFGFPARPTHAGVGGPIIADPSRTVAV